MANETPHEKAVREDREKQARKKAGKSESGSSFRESVREFLTIFNPGAAAIERKVTPEIKKATAAAKKR